MGLFNGYSKPGPGINKNAPKKKGIFLFFELLKRKFFNLMKVNMLHMLVSIPMLAILFFLNYYVLSSFIDKEPTADYVKLVLYASLAFTNILLVTFGSGPASAALAYILRCFTREKHAWLWSDFWDKFKENFKQSIISSLINIIVMCLVPFAARFYILGYYNNSNILFMICGYILILCFVIFTFMHYYLYQFMITFENRLKDIYRNSLILALGKAPMNILITIIAVAITILPYILSIDPVVAFILSFLLLNGLARFVIEFYAARTIEKLIPNEHQNDEIEEESIFSDEIKYNEVEQTPISFN